MIVINDYDPNWPLVYERERAALVAVLGPYIDRIEHIGSTSVLGLAAKPVIDIGILLNTYPLPEQAIAAVEALGYVHKGEYGVQGRHYFRKGNPPETPRTHHVHAYSPGNPEWQAHILFRDYLRAHSEAAQDYERLKRELAAHHADRGAYTEDKTGFVHATLAKARAEKQK